LGQRITARKTVPPIRTSTAIEVVDRASTIMVFRTPAVSMSWVSSYSDVAGHGRIRQRIAGM
jgi:hypothetical protein